MLEQDLHEILTNNDFDSVTISLTKHRINIIGNENDSERSLILAHYSNNNDGLNRAIEITTLCTEFLYFKGVNP